MAYDEVLAERVRELLAAETRVSEQRMFGGLGLMINGNMAVAVRGQGGLLVRVDPADDAALVAQPGVEVMEMRGKQMRGWLTVEPGVLDSDAQLRSWVERGAGYARSLPPR